MQWLLHGPLAAEVSPVADALVRHEHVVHRPGEINLPPEASGEDVLTAAAQKQWDVITVDSSLAMAPFSQGKSFRRSIVYLQLQGGEVELDDAVDRLFTRFKRLTSGRLYTVTATRVKVRQLPRS
jgi:hypothetical protein